MKKQVTDTTHIHGQICSICQKGKLTILKNPKRIIWICSNEDCIFMKVDQI